MTDQASTRYETMTRTMDYEMAKGIIWNCFRGVRQPVSVVVKALEMISNEDYNAIQDLVNENKV